PERTLRHRFVWSGRNCPKKWEQRGRAGTNRLPFPPAPWCLDSLGAVLPERRPDASETHVLVIEGLAVDALGRGRDPAGDLAALVTGDHQRFHELALSRARQPVGDPALPRGLVDAISIGIEARLREHADPAVEAPVGEREAETGAALLADLVEVLDALLVVGDVLVAQHLVHGVA